MLDTMKQTTVDDPTTTLYPTVTYDKELREIVATVIVSASVAGLIVQAPVIAIPGSGDGTALTWNVFWNVQPDNSLRAAGLESIPTPEVPSGNGIVLSNVGPTPKGWEITFENQAIASSVLRYSMHLIGTTLDGHPVRTFHDPTIVITQDPIDG
jgi:hypothetical protein